jgi:Na+-driven multidrug efflux pump
MVFLGAVAALLIGMPDQIVRVFTSDPGETHYAVDCLRIIALGNLFYAFGMVLVQAFNGAGDTVTPTLINLVGFWFCEIPLAWALAYPAGMEVRGVFTSIPIAEALITAMGVALFLKGDWKRRQI